MSASFSRARRRRIAELQERVDLAIDADRRFFERHPERRHRLRLASQAEVRMLEEVHGADHVRIPSGERWYVAVKCLDRGVGARIRNYIPNQEGSETDLPEAACEWVFNRRAQPGGQVEKVETTVRTVIEKWRAMH